MAQRVSYLGSSGDARKSSSQEYSPAQDPAQDFWCLGNSPRLRPGLLLFRRGWGRVSLLEIHLRRPLNGVPQTLALLFLHLVLALTPGGLMFVE